MANIKSAVKRIKVNEAKRERNKPVKSALATEIKKFRAAVDNNELKHAEELLKRVFSALDSAAADNVIHKNKADREKAKLSKLLHSKGAKKSKKPAVKSADLPERKAEDVPAAQPAAAPAVEPVKAAAAPAVKKPAKKGAKK
jgi:small subunit ribosomal protein S20